MHIPIPGITYQPNERQYTVVRGGFLWRKFRIEASVPNRPNVAIEVISNGIGGPPFDTREEAQAFIDEGRVW